MLESSMPMSFGPNRLRVGEAVQSRSLDAVLEHALQRVISVFVLLMLLYCSAQKSYGADNLECPEIGAASVFDLLGDASGGELFVTKNRVDLANEINEAINRLQIASPNISWSNVQDVLVAAYCRVVARKSG